jgi:hypothetical protein
MQRDEALHGANLRIHALVQSCADLHLTGGPHPAPQIPAFAVPPGIVNRICLGHVFTTVPGVDLMARFTRDFTAAGFAPRPLTVPEGPALLAQDQSGFTLALLDRGRQAELYVISPPLGDISGGGAGALVGGIAAGAVLGPIAPCLAGLATLGGGDVQMRYTLAFVPLLLLVGGGLTILPKTRRFGVGLLIGGGATGIITASLCSPLLSDLGI